MTARQLLPDTHPFTKAAAWTKYHLAVAQRCRVLCALLFRPTLIRWCRKEAELFSHEAVYDMVAPGKPIASLDDYLNGIVEILVSWIN